MNKIKKILLSVSFLAILVVPSFSSAATMEELQAQINDLLAQVQQLQQQLAQLQGTTSTWCYDFNVNLKFGDTGDEVLNLQIALGKQGFSISLDEKSNGSIAHFGESTASAVTGFQQKYKDEILTPLGLQYGTGYVGEKTRAKLNSLYGCGVTPTPTPPSITVLSPNGGESWEIGKTYAIKWKTNNLPSEAINKIGINIVDPIKNSTTGIYGWLYDDDNENWTIPSSFSPGQYWIEATITIPSTGQIITDQSDAAFSIVAAGTATTYPIPAGYSSWEEYNKDVSVNKPAKEQGLPQSVADRAWQIVKNDPSISASTALQMAAKEAGYAPSPYTTTLTYVYIPPGDPPIPQPAVITIAQEDLTRCYPYGQPATPPPTGYSSWLAYNIDVSIVKPAVNFRLPPSVATEAANRVKQQCITGDSAPASIILQQVAKESGYVVSPYSPSTAPFYVYVSPSISTPSSSITVLSPSGANLPPGSQTTITWSTNPSGFNSNVGLDLFQNDNFVMAIATVSNNGYYNWTVPTTLYGNGFKIRATLLNAKEGTQDFSDIPFSIVAVSSSYTKGKLYSVAVIKENPTTGSIFYCAGPMPSDGTSYGGVLNSPISCGSDNIPRCASGFRRVMMGTLPVSSTELQKMFTCESMEGQTATSYTKSKLYGAAVIRESTVQGIYYCAGPKPSDGTSYGGILNDPIYCGSDNIPKCKSGFRRIMTGILQVSSAEMEKTFTCESMEGQTTISYTKGELYSVAVIKENPTTGSIFYCAGPMPSDGTSYAGALNSPISCGSDNIPRCVSGFRRVMMGTLSVSSTELQKMFTCENMTGYIISSSLNLNQMANILESAQVIFNQLLEFLKNW